MFQVCETKYAGIYLTGLQAICFENGLKVDTSLCQDISCTIDLF